MTGQRDKTPDEAQEARPTNAISQRDEILASARDARLALMDLDHRIQSERDGIVRTAALEGRELTEPEKAKRKVLRADQAEVRDAFTELAFVTMARLDSSPETAALNRRMAALDHHVQAELNELKGLGDMAETVDSALQKVAQLADSISKFAV